ncbi:NADH-quinone oxidoreductase subunit NuoE [Thermotalea metallivorans]|uniref:NADP-reducing hydrogenase subunit HndA n=1 Tax=Thermotalea metallivorans TaxID=520762 RepID=A0A140KZL6_9FIRM|nr:NADH-quinone oxidoreductase subunit NuoE [Thermotalea metallivorans]KXG73741.1 NADP-reducing hydrogenase subunit HndA [Thermotalea metallivorans]
MSKARPKVQTMDRQTLPKEKYDALEEYIDGLETKEDSLIQVLHKAQEIFGYLPREVQLFIARKLDASGAEVSGVVSFYSYFTTKPKGKHTINVCMGTACFVKGADKLFHKLQEKLGIKTGETTKDQLFTLKDVRCIGACGLAPVLMIDDKVFGRVQESELDGILDQYRTREV